MRLRLTGDDELIGRLQALDKAGSRIARRAIQIAAQPVIDEAEKRARPISKTIAEAITVDVKTKKRGAYHVVRIGPMEADTGKTVKAKLNPITGRVKARWHNPAKTGHLLELGTKPHRIRIYGRIRIQHPGAKAYPYLGPALEAQEGEAQDVFFAEAWQGIRRELSKRAKKAARIEKKANKILAQMGGDE